MKKVDEILRHYLNKMMIADGWRPITDEDWKDKGGKNTRKFLRCAMKEYAEYIAKCAQRDQRISDAILTDNEDPRFIHNAIFNNIINLPKELEL